MAFNFMSIYRLVIFGLCILLSIAVIGLTSDITHLTNQVNVTYSFETLSLLIGVLSLLVFPLLLAVSHFRKNAFLVYIVYELGIVFFLWIFWVVAAALTIQKKNALLLGFSSCSVFRRNAEAEQKCNEIMAIQGLEVLAFVLLLKYMLVLFVYTLVVYFKTGNGQVWFQGVSELEGTLSLPSLTHKSSDAEAGMSAVPMGTYPNATGTPQPQMSPATYGGAPAQTATY
ncbi:hypothetical protein BJ912DRAFT_990543 [Pholiota molesta]|nr:hypothetical protein BJ912DRAFT_990543 [Pholiota molesta]